MIRNTAMIVLATFVVGALGCANDSGETASKPNRVDGVPTKVAVKHPRSQPKGHARSPEATGSKKARARKQPPAQSQPRARKEHALTLDQVQAHARRGPSQVDHASPRERRLREIGARQQGKSQVSKLSPKQQRLLEEGAKSQQYQP
jgi:hypothetical protein